MYNRQLELVLFVFVGKKNQVEFNLWLKISHSFKGNGVWNRLQGKDWTP